MSAQNEVAEPKIVWGGTAIAPYLGKSEKGAWHALEAGKVPGARKIGGRWGLNLSVFYKSFETTAA